MSLVLGVDGGNSKTLALVSQIDGTILGCGRGGCGDIYGAVSEEAALAAIDQAVGAALQIAGAQRKDLAVGGFSLAGADWPEDIAHLGRAMRERAYGREVAVVNDAVGALWAGSPSGVGVAVNLGTGSAIAARAADGRAWHGSFWLEDMGAGTLGTRALRAVYRAELGIDPPTTLAGKLTAFYSQETVEDLLHLFTARLGKHPRNVAQLARILLDTADEGDPAAQRLIREAAALLGDYALVAVRKVGLAGTPFPLVLAGGVVRHPSHLLPEALLRRVQSAEPGAYATASKLEPVGGALILALETLGTPANEAVLDRMAASMPGPAFFATHEETTW